MQKRVFSVLMAGMMVLGMESYNKALVGGIGWQMFDVSPVLFLGLLVITMLVQENIGAPLAGRLCALFAAGRELSPGRRQLLRQFATVCVMCPLMSLVAVLLIKQVWTVGLPLVWVQTIGCNFPMALLWQVLVAGPVVRGIVSRF